MAVDDFFIRYVSRSYAVSCAIFGKVSKEELDKCSTCDMCAVVNNGLSAESQAQLKEKTGEEIVDADIAAQLKK